MYLGDPAAAVEPFERYKAISGEDRPITSWIADVKQRAGKRDAPQSGPDVQVEARDEPGDEIDAVAACRAGVGHGAGSGPEHSARTSSGASRRKAGSKR